MAAAEAMSTPNHENKLNPSIAEPGVNIGPTVTINPDNTVCFSSWGYPYSCIAKSPILESSTYEFGMSTFIGGRDPEAKFKIWNRGGGFAKLTGTATVQFTAPYLINTSFTIVSGSTFSLWAGEPQEIVVRFNAPKVDSDLLARNFDFMEFPAYINLKNQYGTLLKQVKVTGFAMTKAKFIQMLSDISKTSTLTATMPTQKANILLDGFENTEPSQIDWMIQLAETPQFWDMAAQVLPDLGQASDWWARILWYIATKALDFLFGQVKDNQIDMSKIIDALTQLSIAPINGCNTCTTDFNNKYGALYAQNPDFKKFVDALSDLMGQAGAEVLIRNLGANNAQDAAKSIIQHITTLLAGGRITSSDLSFMIENFGPAGAFGISGLARLGTQYGDYLQIVINEMRAIVTSQTTLREYSDPGRYPGGLAPWINYDRHQASLRLSLSHLLAALGTHGMMPSDPALREEFNKSMAALAVAGRMARSSTPDGINSGGWFLFAVRIKGTLPATATRSSTILEFDVLGQTRIFDKTMTVFTQVFHAVTGYQDDYLSKLATFVRTIANLANPQTGPTFLGPDLRALIPGLSQEALNLIVKSDYFGVVAVVKSSDGDKAKSTIEKAFGTCGRCFGIVITVENNRVVAIVPVGNVQLNYPRLEGEGFGVSSIRN